MMDAVTLGLQDLIVGRRGPASTGMSTCDGQADDEAIAPLERRDHDSSPVNL